MKEKERSKLYLERLLNHQAETRNRKFYAIQRIDLLVISISGAGIYVIFETLKYSLEKNSCLNLTLLKFAGLLFVLSIISNFLSQWSGYNANKLDIKKTEFLIDIEKGEEVKDKSINNIQIKINQSNTYTKWLNFISTGIMIVGIVLLTLFYMIIF